MELNALIMFQRNLPERKQNTGRQGKEVMMTPELGRLLNEGLEKLDQAKTTDELRRRS